MDIIFKTKRDDNGGAKTSVMVCVGGSGFPSTDTILNLVRGTIKEYATKEESEKVSFNTLYADIKTSPTHKPFSMLVRMINGIPSKIMSVAYEYTYRLNEECDNLNAEMKKYGDKEQNVSYVVFDVRQ